jgi:hypothetical protein
MTILSLKDLSQCQEMVFRDQNQILITEVIGIEKVREHTYKVKVESEKFIEFVRNRFTKYPGSILEMVCLDKDHEVDPLALFEDEIRKIK